jgi:hypothetical protein
MAGLRVVVSGSIAQYPLGGMTWHHLQYVLGLVRLGHDVYYLEDTGAGPYDPRARSLVKDPTANISFLAHLMSRYGLGEKWAYCHLQEKWMGLSRQKRDSVIASADLVLNVSGMLSRPLAYRSASRLVYVDTDPVFNQLQLAQGDASFSELVDAHDVHFTFGERIVKSAPQADRRWLPTRQPVMLSEWRSPQQHRGVFSTVMNWRARNKTRVFRGQRYGEKDAELLRFIDLPALVRPARLELALNSGKNSQAPVELLSSRGWRVVDPHDVCLGPDSYRSYVESSMGEWSIAKEGYVRGRPGWFSERSACYLAAGRPVILQDTGFPSVLPVGEGLMTFETVEDAAAGVREVTGNYSRHSRAARDIAHEYFDSDKVLAALVEDALRGSPPDRTYAVGGSGG